MKNNKIKMKYDQERFERYEFDSLGNQFKSPVEKRVKKSKFAKLLAEMSDEEIKALGFCMLTSPKVKKALKYLRSAVEGGVQIYALEQEVNKRFR